MGAGDVGDRGHHHGDRVSGMGGIRMGTGGVGDGGRRHGNRGHQDRGHWGWEMLVTGGIEMRTGWDGDEVLGTGGIRDGGH